MNSEHSLDEIIELLTHVQPSVVRSFAQSKAENNETLEPYLKDFEGLPEAWLEAFHSLASCEKSLCRKSPLIKVKLQAAFQTESLSLEIGKKLLGKELCWYLQVSASSGSLMGKYQVVPLPTTTEFFLMHVEKKMEQNEDFPLTLVLGTLSIPLEELATLNVGSFLKFSKPEPFEGGLLIGGELFAKAKVVIESEEISVEIIEVVEQS